MTIPVKKKLDDVCLLISDCPHSTAPDEGEGYPLIRTPNIGKGRFLLDGVYRVSERVYKARNCRATPKDDDIIFAREAPAGNAAIIKNGEKYCLGQRTVLIRPNSEMVYPDYLVYYLLAPEQQHKLLSTAHGATVSHVNIPDIHNMNVDNLPDLPTQHRIASILSAYDDLIENNRCQIKLLEEAAQRLYREWFVELRFPGHEDVKIVDGVPEGWSLVYLQKIINYEIGGGWGEESPTEQCDCPANVIRGTDIRGITQGNLSGIPFRYHNKRNLEARELRDGDIVFEVSGGSKTEGVARTALIRHAMLEQWQYPVICASFCKLVRAQNTKYSQLLFDSFRYMRVSGKTSEYDKRSASSIVNYRWKDFLEKETILIPTDCVLERYNIIAENVYQLIVQKSIVIEKAKEARERLLPKLMSGEMEV